LADPVVTITNGVPTSGTGIITTLGAVVAALPAALAANGGLKIEGVASGVAVPVSIASVPSHAVTNAGTFVNQENGAALTALQLIDDTVVAQSTALGSTKNSLTGASVTTSAPTYTTGNINPLSMDTSGNLRITPPSTAIITKGTAGSASVDVLTVQGAASMTPVTAQMAETGNIVSGAITTAMTGTTTTSLVAAPGASLRNYITTLIVSNSHATVGTDVVIQDGSGGTTLLTIPAAAVYGGAVINLPVPLRQPTANTALYCANVTTGASTKVSAVGFKAA
jgi:hypothetical protein